MYSISAERSAGWSGLAFLVLVVVSATLYGTPPPGAAVSAATMGSFLTAHHQTILISAWLGFPAAAFFLWFAVGVRAHLAHAVGLADGLPLYAILAASITAAIALLSSALLALVLSGAIPMDDLPSWWGLNALLSGPIIAMSSTIFVFAASHSMRRHGSASEGLALYGYLAAFGGAISTLSLFSPTGPMSANGWVTLVMGPGLFVIWVIATSIWLIRSVGASAA